MEKGKKIAILIGVINDVIVGLYLVFLQLYNIKAAPERMITALDIYTKYSILPAILSFVFLIIYYKKVTINNVLINAVFIAVYLFFIWLLMYLSTGI